MTNCRKVTVGQRKKILPFFHSGGHNTNFKVFFGCLHWEILVVFFCICVSIYQPNLRVKSKRYIVNYNASFVSSGIGVMCPPESKKKSFDLKILYAQQVFWSNSLNVYSNVVYLLQPILKPKLKMLMYEKILFSLKIKIGGRKKFQRTQNLKRGQKQ